ncbi:Cysteine desulfurase/Cysteine sulfinate desulfinase IscS or related enzyme [Commensalibacter papalotli (ex Botero et al. 2024)]|uniref:Cysteine desulfurase n=1 Tax=Commensalibacter papalotli (ex Botero et al. 2024) TaxID=2972766 RepID=A0ABM9HLT1_9PROT|nr:Cysteine desulfurase/Cysteine sulfinate desulfinase IscS or related enzyme [Commensalibacter papalotli (ex Botero et al. 2024)]CAI3949094.1 Cysteine desulfurase/Cysteine sulfinate desulfinase IscS or related enzyme [Commensalibacter papalotli (ex Botero et al. 2024)]
MRQRINLLDHAIYLDYQATTPCDPRVVEEMLPYFSNLFGNAHSEHALGQQASIGVENARQQVADLLGVTPSEIVFTSGATEANNIAIQGTVRYLLKQGATARRVITIVSEHKSVLEVVNSLAELGIEIVTLPVNREGIVDQENLRKSLEIPTLLVSVMAANNETSVLQPITRLAQLAHEYRALFHCDMAQIIGKTVDRFSMEYIDLASISGHKFYGPKGIGTLYVRRKPRVRVSPLFYGGYQERGLRSGTLPVPLIVGLGKACEIVQREGPQEALRLQHYKNQLLQALQSEFPRIQVNGSIENSLPGSINLYFPGIRALDLFKRIPHLYLSTGSACTISSLVPSYVLTAMGISAEQAVQSFRLSFGRMTKNTQVKQVINALTCAYGELMAGR